MVARTEHPYFEREAFVCRKKEKSPKSVKNGELRLSEKNRGFPLLKAKSLKFI